MNDSNPPLQHGYSPVPAGKIATIVTCLEMLAPPPARPEGPSGGSFRLDHWPEPGLDAYRSLFRRVGEDWLWLSRLVMEDDALRAILGDPRVEVHVLHDGDRPAGLLELDFRTDGQCELAFFGLVKEAIGQGAGRFLMNAAIARAWSQPIDRFWVHTCHFDHPAALAFYQRSGFKPYAFMVEVTDDPRLNGLLPREAAPHIPVIDPRSDEPGVAQPVAGTPAS